MLQRCAGCQAAGTSSASLFSFRQCGGKGTERVCVPPEGQAGCRVWMLRKDGICVIVKDV
eukprot:scaffold5077_cov162-Skeletonema_dohrnii-CCMP3373.AAC.6